MHNIRFKAHRAASHVQGGPNYNVFGHTRSRSISDTQNQVHRTKSAAQVPLAIEEQRRLESRQAEKDFGPPQHAGTAPPQSANAAGSQGIPASAGHNSKKQDSGATNGYNETKESADSSDIAVNGSTSRAPSGVHQRKGLKGLFHRHHDEEAALDTAPEGLSVEERRKHAHKRKIPFSEQKQFFTSKIYWLLVFVPVGFGVFYSHKVGPIPVFVINFIAIIPLAALLSSATEDIALRTGETFGGLLNATFGNAVELIVSVQALIKDEITIVKTSLIGSMLSNLLLVLGMAFVVGGYNRLEQHFNVTVAQTAASLLALCVASLIIPTVFHNMLLEDVQPDGKKNQELSRGTAIILLFVYACYLLFQLRTHTSMYNAPSRKTPKHTTKREEGDTHRGIAALGAGAAGFARPQLEEKYMRDPQDEEEEEIEVPQLTLTVALITLAFATTMVAFCSEFMVSSIEGITSAGISTTFVGLILLPIVGNAAEHATAVTVAARDKMDLSIGVAVGSSMQIALLVLPLVVILGWILGKDCMTLYFDTFQIALLFVSVLLVNYLIQDGKSHWLEGVLLMSSYVIIALAAWFYPDIEEQC